MKKSASSASSSQAPPPLPGAATCRHIRSAGLVFVRTSARTGRLEALLVKRHQRLTYKLAKAKLQPRFPGQGQGGELRNKEEEEEEPLAAALRAARREMGLSPAAVDLLELHKQSNLLQPAAPQRYIYRSPHTRERLHKTVHYFAFFLKQQLNRIIDERDIFPSKLREWKTTDTRWMSRAAVEQALASGKASPTPLHRGASLAAALREIFDAFQHKEKAQNAQPGIDGGAATGASSSFGDGGGGGGGGGADLPEWLRRARAAGPVRVVGSAGDSGGGGAVDDDDDGGGRSAGLGGAAFSAGAAAVAAVPVPAVAAAAVAAGSTGDGTGAPPASAGTGQSGSSDQEQLRRKRKQSGGGHRAGGSGKSDSISDSDGSSDSGGGGGGGGGSSSYSGSSSSSGGSSSSSSDNSDGEGRGSKKKKSRRTKKKHKKKKKKSTKKHKKKKKKKKTKLKKKKRGGRASSARAVTELLARALQRDADPPVDAETLRAQQAKEAGLLIRARAGAYQGPPAGSTGINDFFNSDMFSRNKFT